MVMQPLHAWRALFHLCDILFLFFVTLFFVTLISLCTMTFVCLRKAGRPDLRAG